MSEDAFIPCAAIGMIGLMMLLLLSVEHTDGSNGIDPREAVGERLCKDHGGLSRLSGGGKTSKKADCMDGARYKISTGERY